MVSHHEAVRDFTESGLRRMVGAMAAILPFAALIQVLANLSDYRQPAVAIAVWLAMFVAAAWLVPRIGREVSARGEAAAAVVIAVAAAAAIGWEHRPHHGSGSVDLAILGTVWLLALVALSHPARVWVPGALAGLRRARRAADPGRGREPAEPGEARGGRLHPGGRPDRVRRPAADPGHAHQHDRAPRRAGEQVAGRARGGRRGPGGPAGAGSRYWKWRRFPCLRGIADGTLDPADGDVRERCARHAAVLRHSLTDRAPAAGALVAGLQPALQAASARGLLVNVQVIGDPGIPAPEVAHAVLAAVDAVISALPSHQVMLTVLASGGDVELYLTFSEPLRVSPDVARFGRDVPAEACWHAAVTAEETGTGCLEISWRKAAP